jgi:hypothetical protein
MKSSASEQQRNNHRQENTGTDSTQGEMEGEFASPPQFSISASAPDPPSNFNNAPPPIQGRFLPFNPFMPLGVPNDTPWEMPEQLNPMVDWLDSNHGSRPEGEGISGPWGYYNSPSREHPALETGFGLLRESTKGGSNIRAGYGDLRYGGWSEGEGEGQTRYGLRGEIGVGKANLNIIEALNVLGGANIDPRIQAGLEVDAVNANAEASLNPDTGFSLGAQATLGGVALSGGIQDKDSNRDFWGRFGVSEGVGAALRGHWADADGDGYREFGFGADIGPISFDVKSEDPLKDIGLGMIPGIGQLGQLYDGNMTYDAIDGISNAASWAADTASDAWGDITGAASSASDWASDTWDGITGAASSASDWASDTASEAWGGITGAASSAGNWASNKASEAWGGISSAASSATDWAADTASEAWGGVSNAASSAGNWAADKASSAYDWLTDW